MSDTMVELHGELRLVDLSVHRSLVEDGFRPLAGRAESEIWDAIMKAGGADLLRKVRGWGTHIVVSLMGMQIEVAGTGEVLYAKRVDAHDIKA